MLATLDFGAPGASMRGQHHIYPSSEVDVMIAMTESLTSAAKLKIWFAEVRAPFFTATIVPVVLGTAIAWYEKQVFDLLLFGLALLGVVFIHAGTNVVNDYFDYRSGTDRVNRNKSPFNGGSPFIVQGVLTPKQVYKGAVTFFALGSVIGLYLAYEVSYIILVLGLLGVFLGYFYTSPRVNLAALGIGEVAVGLGFGPLVIAGAYVVQTGEFSWPVVLAGLPVGFLIGLVLFINQFPDMEADGSVGKTHWVVRMGLEQASIWYAGLMAATFVTIIGLWLADIYPLWALVGLVPAVIAVKAVKVVLEKRKEFRELVPAQAMTIQVHLLVGVLLVVGYIAAGLL